MMKDDNCYKENLEIGNFLHCYFMRNSWKPLIMNLPDEAAGKLFQAIAAYQDGEEPVIDDPLLNAIFQMMKETFEQDNEKYNMMNRPITDQ